MTDRPRVLRAPTGLIGLVGAAALVLFLLGDVVVRGSWAQALLIAPWMLIPVWLVYVFWYAPHIAAGDDGVRVHNILRITDLPWQVVDDVRMRWQLEFVLADHARGDIRSGTVAAWAVNARRGVTPRQRETHAREESDLLDVLRGLQASAAPAPGAQVARSWDLPSVLSGLAIAALCAVVYLIAG